VKILNYHGNPKGNHGQQKRWRKIFHRQRRQRKEEGFNLSEIFKPLKPTAITIQQPIEPLVFESFEDYANYMSNLYAASDEIPNDEKTVRMVDRIVAKMKEAGISKVLFVCSANLDRSPTAENLFKGRAGLEVKSAGTSKTAMHPLTQEMIKWADKIYVMEPKLSQKVIRKDSSAMGKLSILYIPDVYFRNNKELKKLLLDELASRFV
jgi:predicted protein tyrosine phosphatase